jgi:hypothetical protein
MRLIQTKTLDAAAASIEFTDIPQDGSDLVVRYSLRKPSGGGEEYAEVTLNNISTGYSYTILHNSSNLYPALGSVSVINGNSFLGNVIASNTVGNIFSNGEIQIFNYTSLENKAVSSQSIFSSNAGIARNTILTAGTAAILTPITSLKFNFQFNFSIGSKVSLYKITKGNDGTILVS